ncbi:hypothetical protein C900_05907 [Fulvivirga imtechensis AK7]|uniref:YD repeat protein n=1 Tax=Fulvivirga imtechensis AK7 TaxID=1237149 RepID=L8JMI2_9BACT|nr:hypothetical protein C900_05907 [Fulvivirga imtechensis AK7]
MLAQRFTEIQRTYAKEYKWQSFPSPTAAGITSEYKSDVDHYTGKFNLNIPLLSLKGRNISYGLELSYSSGIKLDQYAGPVGQGFALRTGAISRTVRGGADELVSNIRVEADYYMATAQLTGYIRGAGNTLKNWENMAGSLRAEYMRKADIYGTKYPDADLSTDQIIDPETYVVDSEPDLFQFFIPSCQGNGGISGTFVFDADGSIHVTPEIPGLDVTPFFLSERNVLPEHSIIGFEVTTDEGCKYTFAGTVDSKALEVSWSLSNTSSFDLQSYGSRTSVGQLAKNSLDPVKIFNQTRLDYIRVQENNQPYLLCEDIGSDCNPDIGFSTISNLAPYEYYYKEMHLKTHLHKEHAIDKNVLSPTSDMHTTAWYLTKIERLADNDFIDFVYRKEPDVAVTQQSYSESVSISNFKEVSLNGRSYFTSSGNWAKAWLPPKRISTSLSVSYLKHELVQLERIESSTGDRLVFEANTEHPETPGAKYLDGIKLFQNGQKVKELKFTYDVKKAKTGSWDERMYLLGYESLDRGADREIVAMTEFEFLHDQHLDSVTFYTRMLPSQFARLFLTRIEQVGSNGNTYPPYEFEYYRGILPRKFSPQQDAWGYFNENGCSSGIPQITYTAFDGSTQPALSHGNSWDATSYPYHLFGWDVPNYGYYRAGGGADRSPSLQRARIGNLKHFVLPESGAFEIEYELNKDNQGNDIGGLRVKELTAKPHYPTDLKELKTQYTYEANYQPFKPLFSKQHTMEPLNFRPVNMSNNPFMIHSTKGGEIGYSKVTVQEIYEGSNRGKTEYYMTTPADYPDQLGENILASIGTNWITPDYTYNDEITPIISMDHLHGLVYAMKTFNETNQLVREDITKYSGLNINSSIKHKILTLTPNLYTDPIAFNEANNPADQEPSNFEDKTDRPFTLYAARRSYVAIVEAPKVDSVITYQYGNQPLASQPFESKQKTYYTSYNHVKKEYIKSDKKSVVLGENLYHPLVKEYWYPYDFSTTGISYNASVLSDMNSIKMWSPIATIYYRLGPDGETLLVGGTMRYFSKNVYGHLQLDSVAVASVPSGETYSTANRYQRFDSMLETVQVFDQYNQYNQLMTYAIKDEAPISYLWGYNETLPVVSAVNARQEQLFYESFEETEGATLDASGARAGNRYLSSGSHTLSFTPPADGQTYLMSYWYYLSGEWMLKADVPYVATINELGAERIDEIRVYPEHSLVTTYTYEPGMGITSSTNPNHQTIYYEYDEFGRLVTIRNQNKDIVSSVEYKLREEVTKE